MRKRFFFNFKYSIDDIKWWRFNTGNTITKSILCLFASKNPLRFDNNSQINLQNDWLKIASSKNYHHFFPKSYLKKKGVDEHYINNIVNITIVDDFLNKREIGSSSPSTYMAKFKSENESLESTMKTHLIDDIESFGIWDDNYDLFLNNRATLISKEIKSRIIIQQENGVKQQNNLINDYEEDITLNE